LAKRLITIFKSLLTALHASPDYHRTIKDMSDAAIATLKIFKAADLQICNSRIKGKPVLMHRMEVQD
jgi:hypothetical protein